MIARGCIQLKNTTFTLAAGASFYFDSSAASGTPIYSIIVGYATTDYGSAFVANGTSGSRCTVGTESGSGVGNISMYSTSAYASFKATYTDFANIGNSTFGLTTSAIYVNAGHSASSYFIMQNCTTTKCGCIYDKNCHGAANLDVIGNDFSTGDGTFNGLLGSYGLWLVCADKTTGDRIVTDNIHAFPGTTPTFYLDTSVKGMTFTRNIVSAISMSGTFTSGTAGFQNFSDNLIYFRIAYGTVFACGTPGDTLSNNYIFTDTASAATGEGGYMTPFHGSYNASYPTTWNGLIYDNSGQFVGSDIWQDSGPSGTQAYVVKNLLVIPNSAGNQSGNCTSHGNTYSTETFQHCTLMASGDSVGGSSAAEEAIGFGSTFLGIAGLFPAISNNLVWAKARGTWNGYLVSCFIEASPLTGSATSGGTLSTTQLYDSAAAFPTSANQTLVNSSATIRMTSGTAGNIGQTSTITVNTAKQLTFSPALPNAVASGDGYEIQVANVVTTSGVLNNARWNVDGGTVYNATGGGSASAHGYNGLWNTTAPGSTDLNLGTNTLACGGSGSMSGSTFTLGTLTQGSTSGISTSSILEIVSTGTGTTQLGQYAIGSISGLPTSVTLASSLNTGSVIQWNIINPASNEMQSGPQFLDSSRNMATADINCFGNAAGTAWATGQGYTVGTIVSCASSSFYGGALINYRCITGHTSNAGNATNGQPGASTTTSWRTNWEFASVYRIRQNTTLIPQLYNWVAAGFQIMNAVLANAGSDGVTIGSQPWVWKPTVGGSVCDYRTKPIIGGKIFRSAS
ncbi:MAG: hypothetical protein ACLP9L_26120 [Thermoguttaceae bacterium]